MAKRRVIVVGGGAAGLMAAGQAAACGAETLLLEKKSRPGLKLRITGKGRCNLTNVEPVPEFLSHFGPNGRFLWQSLARFSSADLLDLLYEQGVPTVTERGGRAFPESGQAQDVVDALVRWMGEQGVSKRMRSPVHRLIVKEGCVTGVCVVAPGDRGSGRRGTSSRIGTERTHLAGVERVYHADAVVVATGGASYPATGSTGDGYRMAEEVGHTIVPVRPALVPIETAGDVAARLQGLSLRNVSLRVLVGEQIEADAFGEMLFTHFGVSGPIVLSLSRQIVDGLRSGQGVTLSIDLKPALDEIKLDNRLLRDLDTLGKRQYRTLLAGLLPRKLIPICIEQTAIAPDKIGGQITARERERLALWLKGFRLAATGHRPFSEAIVTAGGVDTREVDPRTMASKLVGGLYFAGEVLDVDGDTGGYNLQAAFSTGWVAGQSAADASAPTVP